ncbi:hypothetical protein LNP74_11605 [Klebsiella pneumoniae subsp. pneumoniae]|nr:hypothetical protein [Klebsiella pneumoniae subsp. pneumoniae]
MYIGIDLGTSGVKAILLNEQGEGSGIAYRKTHRLASASAVVGARSRTVVAGDWTRR